MVIFCWVGKDGGGEDLREYNGVHSALFDREFLKDSVLMVAINVAHRRKRIDEESMAPLIPLTS